MLASFISESRDNLETAGRCFLELEKSPNDTAIMDELFRAVHTMKGSSGLFEIPAFTSAVHVAEDLLDKARSNELSLTSASIDIFLETFDFLRDWIDELENQQTMSEQSVAQASEAKAMLLSIQGVATGDDSNKHDTDTQSIQHSQLEQPKHIPSWLKECSVTDLIKAISEITEAAHQVHFIEYTPIESCFFTGEDPVHLVSQMPQMSSFRLLEVKPWQALPDIDPFTCNIRFHIIAIGNIDDVESTFKYVDDQIQTFTPGCADIVRVEGDNIDMGAVNEHIEALFTSINAKQIGECLEHASTIAELSAEGSLVHQYAQWIAYACIQNEPFTVLTTLAEGIKNQWSQSLLDSALNIPCLSDQDFSTPDKPTAVEITQVNTPNKQHVQHLFTLLQEQIDMLKAPSAPEIVRGQIASILHIVGVNRQYFAQLSNCPACLESDTAFAQFTNEATTAYDTEQVNSVLECIISLNTDTIIESADGDVNSNDKRAESASNIATSAQRDDQSLLLPQTTNNTSNETAINDNTAPSTDVKIDAQTNATEVSNATNKNLVSSTPVAKVLKVDQARIDSLMDLVGELIVAKNALPYLAKRAEEEFGVRTLAKEIKSQYSGLNRLADELQSAVMHIRLVPMSSVFQRFPRLVRDLARKLDKQIELVLEGEETEADKTIVEELADPLIHLVRNSLDHGLESAEERVAKGKPAKGTLTIKAIPKDDQVLIEVIDDGKGIDPNIIKQKAYMKGIIDEDRLDAISDHEALQLIFAAGFSTAEEISDLSGRGVGMDVVKTVINQTGGSVVVESELNKGSCVRLSLPLSMAVSRVMMLELSAQLYGISMDKVAETVRIQSNTIQRIKNKRAIVLREQLIPLYSLADLLGQHYDINDERDEIAVMVVNTVMGQVGLIIDQFNEGIDVIQKPLAGVMSGYPYYSGTALLGDGRVLLVLNIEELIACQ